MNHWLRPAWLLAIALLVTTSATGPVGEASPRAWTIVATYEIPEGASGLAWDGTNIYFGIYGVNGSNVYRLNPANGSYVLQCTGTHEDAYGLTFDGTNLWTTDHPSSSQPAKAMQFSLSGSLITQFNLPATYMAGIAYDNGNFWVTRYYPDPGTVYKVNSSGAVLKQFAAPDNQPWDICLASGNLWIADYWGDMLYLVDSTTGALIDSHASEDVDPAGIVWDGTHLWYCDNGGSNSFDKIYKINLSGAGTPDIEIPETDHDFGSVVLTTPSTWHCIVQNVGTADLQVDSMLISGPASVTSSATFPMLIAAGNVDTISIVYQPTVIGAIAATATVFCNDLITPTVGLTMHGFGVNSGPDATPLADEHEYGNVRMRSYPLWTLLIQNTGTEPLSIGSISSTDPQFTIDTRLVFPIVVNLLDTLRVPIWFYPQAPITYKTTIIVSSNDPTSPAQLDLGGTGVLEMHELGDTLWSYTVDTGFDNSPKAITPIADVNGDSIPDVIICTEDNYIRAFNGNASGSGDIIWEHYISGGSIYNQNSLIVIPDIDEDGYPDVVVGSSWGGRLIRAISGRFGTTIWTHTTTNYGDGGSIYQVDARFDFNNDGSVDVLAATGDDGNDTGPRRVYCLNGLSGVPVWEYPVGAPVFGVIGVSDFTGDGRPDVVAGASNALETQGIAYGLNGVNGAFVWSYTTPGSSVWAIEQLGDVNGDTTPDVMIGDFSISTGNLFILNARTGAMLHQQSGIGSVIRLEPIGDINSDGYVDIMPSHAAAMAYAVSGKDCSYIWSQSLPDKPWCVSAANDLNSDGFKDIMIGTLFSQNYASFVNAIGGATMLSIPYSSPIDALHSIPDIVGDVSMEMVAGGRQGEIVCFSGGTAASPNQAPLQASNPIPADGAPGVETTAVLSWTGGDPDAGDAVFYDVYLGTSLPLSLVSPNQSATTFAPGALQADETYFWRVDTKDQLGLLTGGITWSFSTVAGYLCGDADGSGIITISDAVYLIGYIFGGGPAPNPLAAGDADCTGIVTISDAVYLISYIFGGGPAPCATCP